MKHVFVASLSLSSLSLSSGKKKNKAKKVTSGAHITSGKLYFFKESEVPSIEGGDVIGGKFYLVGASGLKEIFAYNVDEDVRGKGPGTLSTTRKTKKVYIDTDVHEASTIVFGRTVTYAELMSVIDVTPKSPNAPVNEEDFEGDEEVGKA